MFYGEIMDGFLVINKEKGLTSFDVCAKIRKIFNTKSVGHTGTLDPNTTGVLVIAIGSATKLLKLLIEHTKEYNTTVLFGISTDTLDITGNVIEENNNINLTKDLIINKLDELKKETKQIPPMYSAIKVNGKKLYEYARKNIELELEARDITIYDLKSTSDLYKIDGRYAIDLYMKVSKGFYVRSLIRDLGIKLNVPATMYELDRISSGIFNKDMAVSLNNPDILDKVISIDEVFSDLEILHVNDYIKKLVYNGVVLDERQIKTNKPFRVYSNNKLIAIYEPFLEYKYKVVAMFKED